MDFDFSKAYSLLFNGMTEAIEQIEAGNYGKALQLLISCQQTTEGMYIAGQDNTIYFPADKSKIVASGIE